MSWPDFFAWCVAPANVFYTILLAGLALYWLVTAFGLASLDMDADASAGDAGGDGGEGDGGGDGGESGGGESGGGDGAGDPGRVGEIILERDRQTLPPRNYAAGGKRRRVPRWRAVLSWVGVGRVPLIVFCSVYAPIAWGGSFLATRLLERADGGLFFLLLAPNLAVSALLAKPVLAPFRAIFAQFVKSGPEEHDDLSGALCRVASLAADDHYGQAELEREGAPLALSIRTAPGVRLAQGERARVVSGPDGKGVYLVEKG